MPFHTVVGIAAFGALLQEIVHWYDLRENLAEPRYSAMISSLGYWVITIAMIIASGLGTALFYGARISEPDVLLVMGAAFPLVFKKLVRAASADVRLGAASRAAAYWGP